MSVLQTIDLKKYYGTEPNITRALDGVNFSVEDGEFVAVVGTSGSGKSTLLHMMGGLDTPTSGTVIVRGEELAKKNDEQLTIFRRRNIGFIFQNYNLVASRCPILASWVSLSSGRWGASFPAIMWSKVWHRSAVNCETPRSHLDTVLSLMPSLSASCPWVRPWAFLDAAINLPI